MKTTLDFENLVSIASEARLSKYSIACKGNPFLAIQAYNLNKRLSQLLFPIIGDFEVALRNRIDMHYQVAHSNPNWLIDSIKTSGFLSKPKVQHSREKVEDAIASVQRKRGLLWTQNDVVAYLNFGFWKYLFAHKQFQYAGSSLLLAFPKLPPASIETFIYNKLDNINNIRNRIAHHEPIIFDKRSTAISTDYARQDYKHIIDILGYMDIDPELYLGEQQSIADTLAALDVLAQA